MEHLSRTERIRAVLTLFVAVVLFASAFVAIRAIVTTGAYDPVSLTVGRLMVASIGLGVLALARGGIRVPSGRDWFAFIALGAFGQTLYQVLLNTGERSVDGGTAALLVSTSPIIASVLAVIFLGERLTWQGWLGTGIAFAGAAVIAASAGVSLDMSGGVALVLMATLLWAAYQVVQKTVAHGYGPLELTAWPTWIATLVLVPFSAGLPAEVAAAPMAATLGMVWLGAASSLAGFLAWSYAIKRLPVVVSSNALFAVPVAAFLIGLVALGEVPAPAAFAGAGVVVCGVALLQTRGRPAAQA